jgi:toxin ParE1/3/4
LAYSIREHGRIVAEDYVRGINSTIQMAAEFPEIGVQIESSKHPLRSLPYGQHRIYYLIGKFKLSVVRILHQSMDVNRHLG